MTFDHQAARQLAEEHLAKREATEPHWYCFRCQSEKSPVQVTFQEECTLCGSTVVWMEATDSDSEADRLLIAACERVEELEREKDAMFTELVEAELESIHDAGMMLVSDRNEGHWWEVAEQNVADRLEVSANGLAAERDALKQRVKELLDVIEYCEGALSDHFSGEEGLDPEASRSLAFSCSDLLIKHGKTSVIAEARKQPES